MGLFSAVLEFLQRCQSRRGLFWLFWKRIARGGSFYLLDEPESALSPQRQLSLLRLIDQGVQAGSQFILTSHSPILLVYPGVSLLTFDGDRLEACIYQDTASCQVTKLMLDNPNQMFYHLFEE